MNTEHLLLSISLSIAYVILTNVVTIISHTFVTLLLIELIDNASVTNLRDILGWLRTTYDKNVELCNEKYNNYQKCMIMIHTLDDIFRMIVFGTKFAYHYSNDYITTYLKKSSNNLPTHLQGKLYSIDFLYRGKIYKALLPIRGVSFSRIQSIQVDNDEQKAAELVQYMGPNEDFYNVKVSPSTFGYHTVCISVQDEDLNTKEYTFVGEEPIVFC